MKSIIFMVFFVLLATGISVASPNCVTVGGNVAALSEGLLGQAIKLAVQGDDIALQKLINSKRVLFLKDGVAEEGHFFIV